MATKLVRFTDGVLVEVGFNRDMEQPIAGTTAQKLSKAFKEVIQPVLKNVCAPVAEALKNMATEVKITESEVELGLDFETEGNLFIAKLRGEATLTVKITFRGQRDAREE
jgi:hypothetical protein